MAPLRTDKILLPVEIVKYVVKNKLEKPFHVFLFLKFYSSGKVRVSSELLLSAKEILGMSDKRTIIKHFNKLISLKWISFSPKSGYYFIRSLSGMPIPNQIKSKQASVLYNYNLKNIDAFLVGTILCEAVRGQKFFWEVALKRRLKPVVTNRNATNPAKAYARNSPPEYYGLGLTKISKLLGCKKTRASELRKKASDAGFIEVRHHFQELILLDKPDFRLQTYLKEVNPSLYCKIRIRSMIKNGVKVIAVLMQKHDEIRPKIAFKHIK
jgi:hypothetical protein